MIKRKSESERRCMVLHPVQFRHLLSKRCLMNWLIGTKSQENCLSIQIHRCPMNGRSIQNRFNQCQRFHCRPWHSIFWRHCLVLWVYLHFYSGFCKTVCSRLELSTLRMIDQKTSEYRLLKRLSVFRTPCACWTMFRNQYGCIGGTYSLSDQLLPSKMDDVIGNDEW